MGMRHRFRQRRVRVYKWVVDASLLPKEPARPECGFEVSKLGFVVRETPIIGDKSITFINITSLAFASSIDLTGKPVSVKFVSADPAGSYLVDSKSSNVLLADDVVHAFGIPGVYEVSTVKPLQIKLYYSVKSVSYMLDFGDCVIHLHQTYDTPQ
jgi:hypothetical protein